MVRLTSLFPNSDTNRTLKLLPKPKQPGGVIKLLPKDTVPLMPRMIPITKLPTSISAPRIDHPKLMMKTPDGKHIIVKSQGLSNVPAISTVPSLTPLPRRVAKPLPPPPKLHITGSDSDETTKDLGEIEEAENDKQDIEKVSKTKSTIVCDEVILNIVIVI